MNGDDLAREALISLFHLYHDRFILIGGGALHLLHGSPRGSADLDLVSPKRPSDRELKRLAAALEKDLARLPSLSGRKVRCRALGHDVDIRVDDETKVLLQFPTLAAVPSGGERRLITGQSLRTELIVTPTLETLLLCKAVALLKRPSLKGRDAFDVWFLRERGATLDETEFDHWLRWEEVGAPEIRTRLAQLTAKRFKADLARYLPADIARRLEQASYEPLIGAVSRLYAPWLED